jgi:diguanylate cyclase (GGDEF)-like protein
MPRPVARALRPLTDRRVPWREVALFLPALLLCGLWFGGEMVLVVAAVLFPALFLLAGDGRGGSPPRDSAHDPVTGLPARGALVTALDHVLGNAARSGRTTTVFAVGIDDFAALEARYGASAADAVLRRTGERIRGALRATDQVAALDRGQFAAAFAPGTRPDLETALQAAARIQAAAREAVMVDAARIHVTVSVGFCLGPRAPRPTGEAALAAALDALADAQAAGAASVRAAAPDRPGAAARRAAQEAEAVAALESGRIVPWFQPQLSTDTGEVSGVEALARWDHPERGILGPSEFLPTLAAAGMLERLGEQMLFHGLTALKAWDRAGLKVPALAVNLSAEELANPRVAERIAWELDRFDLAPQRLAIEVLETVVADPADETVVRSIAALARLGCRIDLDDFGTGAASLAALRRFAIGRIKIDRSFVVNVDEDRDQQRMITAILSLAERLGLDTLAEGVERVGEHAMLAQLGCGHVQGFGIARPMPFDETIAWMRRHAEKLAATPGLVRRAG